MPQTLGEPLSQSLQVNQELQVNQILPQNQPLLHVNQPPPPHNQPGLENHPIQLLQGLPHNLSNHLDYRPITPQPQLTPDLSHMNEVKQDLELRSRQYQHLEQLRSQNQNQSPQLSSKSGHDHSPPFITKSEDYQYLEPISAQKPYLDENHNHNHNQNHNQNQDQNQNQNQDHSHNHNYNHNYHNYHNQLELSRSNQYQNLIESELSLKSRQYQDQDPTSSNQLPVSLPIPVSIQGEYNPQDGNFHNSSIFQYENFHDL